MQSALDIAVDYAERGGAARITEIRLSVGELSAAVPDALMFAFDVTAKGTIAEGAALDIDEEPAEYRCLGCGAVFSRSGPLCPHCGAVGRAESGYDIRVSSIEVV